MIVDRLKRDVLVEVETKSGKDMPQVIQLQSCGVWRVPIKRTGISLKVITKESLETKVKSEVLVELELAHSKDFPCAAGLLRYG